MSLRGFRLLFVGRDDFFMSLSLACPAMHQYRFSMVYAKGIVSYKGG